MTRPTLADSVGVTSRYACEPRRPPSNAAVKSGLAVDRYAPVEDRVTSAADQVQEVVIEGQLWELGQTTWPPCPAHPARHPLQAAVVDSLAFWVCPADRSVVATIGEADAHNP